MKPKNIILLGVIAVVLAAIIYTFVGSQDQAAYSSQIEKDREERDSYMKSSPESPFAKETGSYGGLKYYPPNVRYKVVATLDLVKDKQPVVLSTSDGKEQHYLPYAYASFDLDGYNNKLLILENMDMGPERGKLFLPFGDETSASETYGAGRYLDVVKTPGNNSITLDFNKAYNPYCAYNDSYSCPFPPSENLLRVAIRAGEKSYH
ncbi:DUF1684 domain-containing protein [Chryseolinea sp. T2]|uniref:DUF1684 domain-containing protein n=1 Tax=Chryseolinea sp. T2 TaxID=3129255 RepID=UPI0030785529